MAAARSVAVEPAGNPRVDPSGNLIVQLVGHGAGGYRVPLARLGTARSPGRRRAGYDRRVLLERRRRGPCSADGKPSAFLVAYSSTYSWPLSSRISNITSSMICRSTMRSSARSW